MKTKVYIQGENSPTPKALELPEEATADDVKQAAIDHGLTTETDLGKLNLFADDVEDELGGSTSIANYRKGNSPLRFFCGRCRLVEVKVRHEGQRAASRFWAGARIRRIVDWATREFGLTGADAENLVLRRRDGQDALEEAVLIGSLVTPGHCELKLHLTPDVLVQG